MKLFVALLAGLVPFAAATSNTGPTCNADNCARAVTGTRLGPSHVALAKADCTTQVNAPAPTIPSYVNNCPNVERYISACNCWGIKPACSNPGKCGTFDIINDPSCGERGVCTCAKDADGRSICIKDEFCATVTRCSTDADCISGKVCWVDNCCGFGMCVATSDICANRPALKLRQLAGKGAHRRGEECSGTGCP